MGRNLFPTLPNESGHRECYTNTIWLNRSTDKEWLYLIRVVGGTAINKNEATSNSALELTSRLVDVIAPIDIA
jgi:hypothetical protein